MRRTRKRTLGALIGAAATSAVLLALSQMSFASAAGVRHQGHGGTIRFEARLGVPLKPMATRNWAGYSLAGSGFTGVTGTFNVPAPLPSESCLEETSVWVGVDGVDNHDLLQAGVAEAGFSAPTNPARTEWPEPEPPPILCGGPVRIFAWWEDLPSGPVPVKLPVAAGDRVTVSIFEMSPGWWVVAIHDLRTSQSFLLAQPYGGPQTSVEWVVEAPQVMGILSNPVPFGSVNFRYLGAEGEARDLDGFSFRSGGQVASPSEVFGSSGQLSRGFTVHWARSRS
jgi:Peptidase A4 family